MSLVCFLLSTRNSLRVNKTASCCEVSLLIRENKEMVVEDKRTQKRRIESHAIYVQNFISPRFHKQ